jgi:hypothetical protein
MPFPEDDVRARAHKIWEREGRPEGRNLEHWLKAEEELEVEKEVQETSLNPPVPGVSSWVGSSEPSPSASGGRVNRKGKELEKAEASVP